MKRFDIKNIGSGVITHSYEAEVELPEQPEWSSRGAYEVIVTDITAAKAAEAAKRDAIKARAMAVGSANSINELKAIVKDIVEYLGMDK